MLKASRLLDNLRHFRYPNLLPLSLSWPAYRRSAVLVVLFMGQHGELRILLTKRSKSLNSFSGHISLPGGKANSAEESFETVARREAEEEIGLPEDPKVLRERFNMSMEHICLEMPCYLSRSFLSVKPLVCLLSNSDHEVLKSNLPLDGSSFTAALNPGETASIFSVPLLDMIAHLLPEESGYHKEYIDHREYFPRWGELRWPIRHYYYPAGNPYDVDWLNSIEDNSSCDELERAEGKRDLWGLTAKILYDVARIAQGMITNNNEEYDIGHEELIYGLKEFGGQLQPSKSPWESGMSRGKRDHKFGDVIPRFYMDKLTNTTCKY